MNKKTKKEIICPKCSKNITAVEPFIGRHHCLGVNKHGQRQWGVYCLDCEPYPKEGDRHSLN